MTLMAVAVGMLGAASAHAFEPPAPSAAPSAENAFSPANVDFFERRIRPLLVEKCHGCHGPAKQEGGLRLDSRAALLKGGDNGPVVVAGRPDESDLLDVITHEGPVKMPPKQKLPPEAIAGLREWVRLGLPWPREASATRSPGDAQTHWAFQPLRTGAPPAVRNAARAQNDVDRYILAALESRQLALAPPADRYTLLRRATFDLLGLPPTFEERQAFESDPEPTPRAFEKVIDRLLASPHYGERWGRYWLDVARYADNKGYVFFEEQTYPWAWAYRDWVVEALNRDLPYNEFIVRQLAADLLEPDDRHALAALGFVTVGGHFINNVHDILDDRIDVVTRGLMGLTVTCARCHDHKYDPIPQADYYGLYGVFRSASEPMVPPALEPRALSEVSEYYEQELARRDDLLQRFLAGKHGELVAGARMRVSEYLLAAHSSRDQPTQEDFMLLIPEGDLHPTVVLRYWLHLQKTRRTHDPVWAPWHALAALPETEFADGAREVCAELGRAPVRPLNRLVVEELCARPLDGMPEVAERYSALLKRVERIWLGEVEQARAAGRPLPVRLADEDAEQIRLAFYGSDAPANVPMMTGWGVITLLPDRPAQETYQKLLKSLETWMIHGPAAPARAMVLADDPVPYQPRIFLRGNAHRQGDPVPRRFLSALAPNPQPFAHGSGRLELARGIVAADNPLTPRVLVNRVWMGHFGTGLVRTAGDFGLRSEPPSHPELLDDLAAAFVREGWSLKKLHRRIMTSAVYQQAGDPHGIAGAESAGAAVQIDPENRLLWHAPRRRLDFEALRDALLAVSGRLDRRIGGPPENLVAGSSRRTIYGFIDRLALPGLFRTFDFPSPDTTSPQRDKTTVAPQALYLMNSPFAQECAQHLAQRPEVLAETTFGPRLDRLYQLVFARHPTAAEVQFAAEFAGLAPPPAGTSLEAAPVSSDQSPLWTRLAQALLLTNEFAFVD